MATLFKRSVIKQRTFTKFIIISYLICWTFFCNVMMGGVFFLLFFPFTTLLSPYLSIYRLHLRTNVMSFNCDATFPITISHYCITVGGRSYHHLNSYFLYIDIYIYICIRIHVVKIKSYLYNSVSELPFCFIKVVRPMDCAVDIILINVQQSDTDVSCH